MVLTEHGRELESEGVDAVPFAYFHATVKNKDVNVVAAGEARTANFDMKSGRHIQGEGEAVADQFAGLDVGDTTDVAGVPMKIVGISKGTTFNFGTPSVFVPIGDTQKMLFAGQPVATAFMITGDATSVPDDLRLMNLSDVVTDMKRPIKQGADSILFINILLWIVAAGIIGSIVYLSALERASDFAVLKATGTSTSSLVVGLTLQAVILCGASALVASLLAQLLRAGFPFEVELSAAGYADPLRGRRRCGSRRESRRPAPYRRRRSRAGVRIGMADLELRDLVIEYSSGGYVVRPIDGLALTVDDGDLVLLLGASGCGKTTLLSASRASHADVGLDPLRRQRGDRTLRARAAPSTAAQRSASCSRRSTSCPA